MIEKAIEYIKEIENRCAVILEDNPLKGKRNIGIRLGLESILGMTMLVIMEMEAGKSYKGYIRL